MKILSFCLSVFLAASAWAQTLTVTASPAQLTPGSTAVLTYTLAGQSSPAIAALQFDETRGILAGSAHIAGPASTAAGKLVTCNSAGLRCVGAGVGQTAIANGVIATSTVTIPVTAPLFPVTIRLSGILAANGTAALTPLASGPDLVITVLPFKEDLNADGAIDIADVTIAVLQVLSNTCNAAVDQNGDGICDVRDVQLVAAKAH